MDEETRIAALKKKDGMKSVVAYPEELINDSLVEKYYNNVEMTPDQYFQNILNMSRKYKNHTIGRLREPIIERNLWTSHTITNVNAFYWFPLNTIGNKKNEMVIFLLLHSTKKSEKVCTILEIKNDDFKLNRWF